MLGKLDAAAGNELGEGEAGGGFEEAAEVRFAEADVFGNLGEVQVFGEVFSDVGGGLFNLRREGVCDGGGETLGVVAKLSGKEGEQGDHAGIAFWFHRFGFEVGFFEGGDLLFGEAGDLELGGDLLEVVFIGGGLENLSGF